MTLFQKIRTSFSTQLSLWVAGFVLVISCVVIFLLTRFSEDVIRDESIDMTMQALENTALRIDNTLRQTEMTARLEHQRLRQLDEQVNRIAEGQFDEPLPPSSRHDSVGRLQNSFIRMQQALAQSVSDIRRVNDELEQHNDELAAATLLKQETNRRKSAFIQDMYHEIRTPLNIIGGFTQVLAASLHGLPDEEVDDITTRMRESAQDISRLTRQLKEAGNPSMKGKQA